MKKALAILMVSIVLLGFAGVVYGAEGDLTEKDLGKGQARLKALREFQDEIHRLAGLKIERNNLQNQAISKNTQIVDLYISSREAGNKEALQGAREVKQQIGTVNKEIRDIHMQIVQERKLFREEIKNGNLAGAAGHINQVIALNESVNAKIVTKVGLLNTLIEILS